jgi:hypothetical protein
MLDSGQRSGDGADAAECAYRRAAGGGLAFVTNPGNDARWGSNLVQVTQLSPGPGGGRFQVPLPGPLRWPAVELVREVTEYQPNRRQAVKIISGPLRWGGVGSSEAIPGGTRITLTGSAAQVASSAWPSRCCCGLPSGRSGPTWPPSSGCWRASPRLATPPASMSTRASQPTLSSGCFPQH